MGSCNFVWGQMIIGNGISVDVFHDIWISSLPLSRWLTFISSDLDCHLHVNDCWRAPDIIRLFGGSLADQILAVPIPVHQSQDMRMWRCSCHLKVPMRDLIKMYRPRWIGR